jgi:hypothetical protein
MKQYIGNCQSKFNCDDLIKEILGHSVEPSHGHMTLEPTNPFYAEYIEQTNRLKMAGYSDETVEYRHYQAGKHFSNSYADYISEIVNAKTLMCWVSEIRPGKCTPWHWDINPWEEEHKQLGKLVRYFCFLSAPAPGHIFVTEEDAYYNEPQGSIYQYSDIHTWHAGSNVGLVPKFLLTLTGYQ